MIKAGASETVFDAVNRQLSRHGYIARGGQMIDASIVQTPKQSIKREEKELVADQAMPADWSPAKRRQQDAASPRRAPASSMFSPGWRNWAARRCARSAWHAPR